MTAEQKFSKLEIDTRVEEGMLHASIRRVAEEDGADLAVMGTKGISGDFNPKTVGLASTLTEEQVLAFSYLALWQKMCLFKVKVLYWNNPGSFGSKRKIDAIASAMAERAGLEKVETYININPFNEESTILEFARQENADLIVMATHQRRGLSHLLFGSLTEDAANHSSIPVLSVPLR